MVANVLIALNRSDTLPEAVVEKISKVYRFKLLHNNRTDIGIGRVDFVYTEKEIEANLLSNRYDVLLVTETIEGNINIGAGTLRKWKENYPDVRIFLLVEKEKKGAGKLTSLYVKGYYDALYWQEIAENEDEFFETLLNGRSKEHAFEYYGLTQEQVDKEFDKLTKKKKLEEEATEEVLVEEAVGDNLIPPEEWTEEKSFEDIMSEDIPLSGSDSAEEVPLAEDESFSVDEKPELDITDGLDEKMDSGLLEDEEKDFIESTVEPEEILEEYELVDEKKENNVEDKEVEGEDGEDFIPYSQSFIENYSEPDIEEEEGEAMVNKEQGADSFQEHYPQIYLDLEALKAEAKVHYKFDAQISEIITDDVMIIKCPGGGLLRNKEALKGLKVQITWEEQY